MNDAKINGTAAAAEQIKGADMGVSRETPRIGQRIMDEVMGRAENLCASARTLVGEVYLPLFLLVRVNPDEQVQAMGHNLGDMLIGAPPVVSLQDLRGILAIADRALVKQDPQAQAQAEPEPELGNEGDAMAAMQQEMAKPPEMDIPGDDA